MFDSSGTPDRTRVVQLFSGNSTGWGVSYSHTILLLLLYYYYYYTTTTIILLLLLYYYYYYTTPTTIILLLLYYYYYYTTTTTILLLYYYYYYYTTTLLLLLLLYYYYSVFKYDVSLRNLVVNGATQNCHAKGIHYALYNHVLVNGNSSYILFGSSLQLKSELIFVSNPSRPLCVISHVH